MDAQNPFADFGTTVFGQRFIGRSTELRQVESRLLGRFGFGSIAIIGLPRIGKTSLLAEFAYRYAGALKDLRAVLIRVDTGSFQTPTELFRSIADLVIGEIESRGWMTGDLARAGRAVHEESVITYGTLAALFRSIRSCDIRAICVLDEFDTARYLFASMPQCFHWIRQLSSDPELKAALVLISKRRLQDIARLAGYNSNYWSNVLMTLTLRTFSSEDVDTYWNRLDEGKVTVPAATRAEVTAVCGTHPYLLDVFAFHAWNRTIDCLSLDVLWLRRELREMIRSYYQQVVTILQDSDMLSKFAQVMIGPRWNLRGDDIEALVDYGVLQSESGGGFDTFSSGFTDFVRLTESSLDLWPLWRETETSLRDAIEYRLQKKYGERWIDELKKARPNVRSMLERCEQMIDREIGRFGEHYAPSLISYTYPMELYQLMNVDWSAIGEPLLGSDKQNWSVKFNMLSKVRTPLAHNRLGSVSESERLQTEGICREILERLRGLSTSQLE